VTSPVAVIGLTYDGYDLQRADLDIFFQITEGLDTLPETRGDDQLIPFRTGRLAQSRMADRRPVVAMGWVTRPSVSQTPAYRAYLDGLKAKLEPTALPRVLVATLEDGSKRWINAVPRDLLPGDGWGSDFRSFSIEWEALDPYWYSAYGSATLDSGLYLDAGWYLDDGADLTVAGSGDYALTNPGTADSEKVRVIVTGPSSGAVGVEVAGAVPVGFTYPLLATGETLTVDNDARTVVLTSAAPPVNGRQNLILRPGNEHGEYLRLPPGAQTIRVSGNPVSTRIHFLPAYN
jgi:hypothetical protein